MSNSLFYCLTSPHPTKRRAEWKHDVVDLETIYCPRFDGHQRPGKRLTLLTVELPGDSIDDFVWTWYSECLLSDRVVRIFEQNGVTGFETRPATAVFKKDRSRKPQRLWELVVTGWAGMAPSESGIHLIEQCPACGHAVYSKWHDATKIIDSSKWDGSDIFMVWPLPMYVFCTERVRELIRANRLSGVVAETLEDLDKSSSFSSTLTPGRLRHYMPEERARECGESLGIY